MIADSDTSVANLYDMIHPEADATVTVRSVFVIDPAKKIRLILTYPPSAGRNFQEVLRTIDSLQLTDSEKVSTPINWQPGDRVVISPPFRTRRRGRSTPKASKPCAPICDWCRSSRGLPCHFRISCKKTRASGPAALALCLVRHSGGHGVDIGWFRMAGQQLNRSIGRWAKCGYSAPRPIQ
jgi:hypothetical protein